MEFLGTGFLYNWGGGISGQQFVPKNLTGRLFSGLAIGENFNATVGIPKIPTVPIPTLKTPNLGRFNFGIYNLSQSTSPINSFQVSSTISGSGFNSEEHQYNKKILIFTQPKDFNVISNRGFISLGSGLITGVNFTGTGFLDTYLNTKRNNLNSLSSDSWLESSGAFLTNDFIGFDSGFAGAIIRDINVPFGSKVTGINSKYLILSAPVDQYEINYGTRSKIPSGNLGNISLLYQNLNVQYPISQRLSSNNKAWASYQLSEPPKLSGYGGLLSNSDFSAVVPGTINRTENVFAYAFQLVDIVTLRDSGTLVISGNQEDPFETLKALKGPVLLTGFNTSFSNYLGYCFQRKTCEDESPEAPEDVTLCWTGSGSEPPPLSRSEATGRLYLRFLSGVIEQYGNQSSNRRPVFDSASALTLSSGVLVSGLFSVQTGAIIYNSFFTGDSLSFNLYPFDYTGFYQSYHLNNQPLFPGTGFTIKFPQDFTGIDSLVETLNSRLKNISYPVWYPYDCLSGESTGIYITGGLMEFEKDLSFSTGSPNYNNIINFQSLRNYPSGFQLSLNLVDREEYIYNLELEYFRKGFSYLIPDTIELQGKTGDQWMILDRRINLYNMLTGLERTEIPLDADPEIFLDDDNFEDFLSSSQITGTEDFNIFDLEDLDLGGGFLTLREFRQRGVLLSEAPPECLVPDLPFDRGITIITPTGFQTGVNGCEPPKEKEKCDEPCSDIIPFCDETLGCVLESRRGECGCLEYSCKCPKTDEKLELSISVLRTGWNLELTGIYLNCLTGPNFDPKKINFPEYRFVAKNFSGLKPSIENQFLIPKTEAYFTNINLFSLKPSGIGIHEGAAQCLIGSNYILDIADTVAFPFSGVLEYSISGEDRSGVYKALNQPLFYTPTDQERNVKFVRRSGKIVGNVTGLVNGEFTGSNVIEHTFFAKSPSGYWYRPENKQVYFSEKSTGFFVKSGILTENVFMIKEEVINFELLAGGRLNTTPEYIELTSGGFFTGLLRNQRYFQTGAQGIYRLTGKIEGFSTSGFFDVIIPTGTVYTGRGFLDPIPTGRIYSGFGLLNSGFTSQFVQPFPSESFVSGNLNNLFNIISGEFITNSNFIFSSPEDYIVSIINTGFLTGTLLNNVKPRFSELLVSGDGEYRSPNDFVFRNKLNVLMTGDFLAQRRDQSCFKFWPNVSYPLYTVGTITGLTSQAFITGITGIETILGNLIIEPGSFGLLSGFVSGKEVYYNLPFVKNETVLITNQNNFNSGEERIKGLYKIQNIVSGQQESSFSGNKYLFSCLRDEDVVFNSPLDKEIYLSSTGFLIGRPVFADLELMNETINKPFFPIPTGFEQASARIDFNFNNLRIFDRLSINNISISYHPDTDFFFAPDFFNSVDSLLLIINNNFDAFTVTGEKINETGILLTALDFFNPGDQGNNIQISTRGSGIISPISFTGGATFYPEMQPTSLFSGFAYGKMGITGIFSGTQSGIITGQIPTYTGTRSFTGVWGLKSGINYNLKSFLGNNLLSGNNKYFNTQLFEGGSYISQLSVSYENELNTTEQEIFDVAEFKIKDLNYNKIFPTGNPNVSGEVIFRITGLKNL